MPNSHPEKPPMQWTGIRSTDGGAFTKSGLFIFILGQLITAVVGIAVFLITFGGFSEKFRQITNKVAANEAVLKRMDEQGTNFSHYSIMSDDKRLTAIEVRITTVESAIKKLDVMDEKITRIDESVREIRSSLGHKP